jgi:prepilin-type processing-associated H-X9-DG protein
MGLNTKMALAGRARLRRPPGGLHTARWQAAFTRRELLVVATVVLVVVAGSVIWLERAKLTSQRLCCNCNLKQIGTAYRVWEDDNFGVYPAQLPEAKGGCSNLLHRVQDGAYAWTNYVMLADCLGPNPGILVCPADERKAATSFSNLMSNTNISYFVGLDAQAMYPQSLLGGDRNLGPGPTPDPNYGFSPADGRGRNVLVQGRASWSLKMHSPGTIDGNGNLLFADGSVQQVYSSNLYDPWLKDPWATEDGAKPVAHAPGQRIIFP